LFVAVHEAASGTKRLQATKPLGFRKDRREAVFLFLISFRADIERRGGLSCWPLKLALEDHPGLPAELGHSFQPRAKPRWPRLRARGSVLNEAYANPVRSAPHNVAIAFP
jgi:hypothetical protein